MLTALVFASALLVAPVATAPTNAATTTHAAVVTAKHSCTRTSSGSCIRGGQFCPRASYGKSGYDAKGRRYKCKGSRTHPHWMK
ncbi:hypothetical protein [Nocardioides sp.]|uniref:hypothetical protein n=1 Tax=Nocardioides sp. TaxID=35761 RepID=UPI00262E961B|nr:hypothetical protein [Nocardioides sp.]